MTTAIERTAKLDKIYKTVAVGLGGQLGLILGFALADVFIFRNGLSPIFMLVLSVMVLAQISYLAGFAYRSRLAAFLCAQLRSLRGLRCLCSAVAGFAAFVMLMLVPVGILTGEIWPGGAEKIMDAVAPVIDAVLSVAIAAYKHGGGFILLAAVAIGAFFFGRREAQKMKGRVSK